MNVLSTWEEIQDGIIDKYINNSIITNEKVVINDILFKEVNKRLESPIFKDGFALNTLRYLFFHIRSAIYVNIKDNELIAFIPFANKDYENNWHMNIKLDTESKSNKLHNFIQNRRKYIKKYKKYIPNVKNWWTNASIINNEKWDDGDSYVWGQHSFNEYKSLIESTLSNYTVKDCQFFINKRDHPLLHYKLSEPYDKLYPKMKSGFAPHIPDEYYMNSFVPIVGPYTSDKFLDIPFVIPEDWNLANGLTDYKIEQSNIVEWRDKINIAFWRGSGTGSPEFHDNQRLQITKLDNMWKDKGMIDAGIVSWNVKDKVVFDKKQNRPMITFIKIRDMEDYGIKLKPRVPMNEQLKYKYILNIDGHSAPNRTSYLLQSGCLILQVESKYVTGNIYWYSKLLKPHIHYIPISYDFTDLEEKLLWCQSHDNDCRQITVNAKKFYDTYLSKTAILDYTNGLLNSL